MAEEVDFLDKAIKSMGPPRLTSAYALIAIAKELRRMNDGKYFASSRPRG